MKKIIPTFLVIAFIFSSLPAVVNATTGIEANTVTTVSTQMSATELLEEARRAVVKLKEEQKQAMEKKMQAVRVAAELKKQEAAKLAAEKKAKLEAQRVELKRKEAEKKTRNEAYRAAVKKAQQQHKTAIAAANRAYQEALKEAKKLLVAPDPVAVENGRRKERDTKRLADLKQLQTALELYYTDQGGYPAGSGVVLGKGNFACLNSSGFTALGCVSPYMRLVPSDPLSAQSYVYTVGNGTYSLTAVLETSIYDLSGGITLSPSGIAD